MSGPAEVVETVSIEDAARATGAPVGRVRQWIRDGALVIVDDDAGRRRIPAAFLTAEGVVKGLSGVITLLRDVDYRDEEIVRWLFAPDDSLPGTPIQALRENRGGEVKRRAQASGF